MSDTPKSSYSLDDLIYLMQRLRKPETGCPWDLKQDYRSITPSTIEEAYEVVDAIERKDYAHLKEELGDLLFQVIFYSQLASEDTLFDFHGVVDAITSKLLRRHPHVFPNGTLSSERAVGEQIDDAAINANWEAIKQSERNEKGSEGVFDDLPHSLPGISRAVKLQKRAAKFGFDWEQRSDVVDKLKEELEELEHAMQRDSASDMEEELGDVLFTCVNLARHLGKDPEAIIRQANLKFERRVSSMDRQLRESDDAGANLLDGNARSPEVLDQLWRNSKKRLTEE